MSSSGKSKLWRVEYAKSFKKDLKALSSDTLFLIRRAIEEKLMIDSLKFGVPLRRSLKGLMKLRVGDHRIIYKVQKRKVIVFVIKIGHRRDVYK